MISDVRVESRAPLPVAAVRRTAEGPLLGRIVQDGCGAVWNALRAQGLKGGRNIAIYWDAAITVDAGVEMPASFIESGDVKRGATPGGLTVSVTHFGPYQRLGSAHDAIWTWARQNGKTLVGPRWEIYGHWLPEWNADPSKIRTDVVYLVAP